MTLVNGTVANVLEVGDRGLAYGDGVFETIAIVDGEPQHWQRHLDRLRLGAERLGIPAPGDATWHSDWSALAGNCPGQAVLKLLLTRGSGGRGYIPATPLAPNRIARVFDRPEWPVQAAGEGVSIGICSTRLARNPLLAGIKHLNRLEQVLASIELANLGAVDGLMLDTAGNVVETSRANVFLVTDGALVTPAMDHCGIAGVMRDVILQACRDEGISVREESVDLDVLMRCSEMFLCNSLIGIWPVRQVIGAIDQMPVGGITRRLQKSLRKRALLP